MLDKVKILVWDLKKPIVSGNWQQVLWQAYSIDEHQISIPKLVEEQSDKLRESILSLIYELGEHKINNKRLIDSLEIKKNFSYWWMTLLAGKRSHMESPRFYDVARLLVFVSYLDNNKVDKIILASEDEVLVKIFRKLCKSRGIDFQWQKQKKLGFKKGFVHSCYSVMPNFMRAFIFASVYFFKRWPLKEKSKNAKKLPTAFITFVDYFCSFGKEAIKDGKFTSNYWTKLLDYFVENKIPVNWMHNYIEYIDISTSKKAADLRDKFNRNGSGLEYHWFVDGVISINLLYSSLCSYLKIFFKGILLTRHVKKFLQSQYESIDLWPLFKSDWCKSVYGIEAMANSISLNLFEHSLRKLEHQKLGIYLQENQAWEMAFIYCWRACGHGKLIGVQHTTVRYWDLRYHFYPKLYMQNNTNCLPMPDFVAANGDIALNDYLKNGYPANKIMQVEALRYLYLLDKFNTSVDMEPTKLRLLICGDCISSVTRQMLMCFEEAYPSLSFELQYLFKPFPNKMMDENEFSSFAYEVVQSPLVDLLVNVDVVFTSNITSAAVDAYVFGVPVLQFLDGNRFNMSALRGFDDVIFVSNKDELVAALEFVSINKVRKERNYFCLDKRLPRWQSLLNSVIN